MNENEITELITRRRRQVLAHSFAYYRMNETFIDDATYDKWAKELAELQRKYPEIAEKCQFAEEFKTWEEGGNYSGFSLPLERPEIIQFCLPVYNSLKRKGK
jgi:hypothetical protein